MSPQPTGVGVYGLRLTQALVRRSPASYALLYPWQRWRRREHLRKAVPGLPILAYSTGSRIGRRFRLLHTLDTRVPCAYRGPLVAQLFDTLSLLPLSERLGLSDAAFRRKKERAYRVIASRAAAIVTLSEAVRREILERLPTRADVVVIPPGVEPPPAALSRERARALVAAYGLDAPFVLAVGALCPRKNLEAAARAFEGARKGRPRLKLFLAGEPAYGWKGSPGEAACLRLGDAVVLGGYLPRENLWAAYLAAEAVLHLSHYEGYGLTVLEALAAGTPVVASRRGGIAEAGGGAAWLVDPEDPAETAATLRQVLDGGAAVKERQEAGRRHAAGLTWDLAAERLEVVYRQVGGLENW